MAGLSWMAPDYLNLKRVESQRHHIEVQAIKDKIW
jgi:hypothetical protein